MKLKPTGKEFSAAQRSRAAVARLVRQCFIKPSQWFDFQFLLVSSVQCPSTKCQNPVVVVWQLNINFLRGSIKCCGDGDFTLKFNNLQVWEVVVGSLFTIPQQFSTFNTLHSQCIYVWLSCVVVVTFT